MLNHDHDHDFDSTILLRQRSLRRAANIQHSPLAVTALDSDSTATPTASSPPLPTTPPPPSKSKPTSPTTKKLLANTMSNAIHRFQAFRHARSSSSSSSSSNGKTTVTSYHKRKHLHARSHSTPTGAETQSQTLTPMVPNEPTRVSLSSSPSPSSSSASQPSSHLSNGTTTESNGIDSERVVIDVPVPPLLREGTQMTKVTSKKRKKVNVRLDPDMGQIIWEVIQPGVTRQRIIPIENIKEMRSASDARYYREQFQLSQVYQDCWLTIIYILDGAYKTLHLIAPSVDVFRIWDATLRKLYAIRMELMSGLGNVEMRQALWEKQYWKGSELEENERLRFGEVEKLCRRMNIHSSAESLFRLFKQADLENRGYLDFDDFRRFVKLLKGRPEIDRLYKKLVRSKEGVFDFKTFEYFMREVQKSGLSHAELKELFEKYASYNEGVATLSSSAFTSFLMSADNAPFMDQHNKVWHDMTRPLSDYFIASSHNTYLVGHQLVGVSTVEGYIRALLHSCRSVEVDIYDGDIEPMIFHGKTFTSKVSLRQVCHAIIKYGFVVSPWPIIISAEVHCSVSQQDMIADILIEVFGSALVRIGPEGRTKLAALPSPEELKGRILFKTKDVTALRQDSSDGTDVFLETSGTSSASDSDALQEAPLDVGMTRRSSSKATSSSGPGSPVSMISPKITFSPPIQAARTVIQRVRHAGKSSAGGNVGNASDSGSSSSPGSTFLRLTGQISQSPRSETNIPDVLSPLTPGLSPIPPPSPLRTPTPSTKSITPKPKISPNLQSLLVYTVGVKFQGINKKVDYAPEHMFSLSETTANKIIRPRDDGSSGMYDLIKHCRKHLVRIYPKGLRVSSSNYEPHRYWSAGTQLVAINWQTFDLGYMINHAMFQRNGRAGYVLKPAALRSGPGFKELLGKRTRHFLDLTVISGQQLPRLKDSSGREMVDRPVLHPYVEVTVHVPDWTYSKEGEVDGLPRLSSGEEGATTTTTIGAVGARSVTYRTSAVKNNGFNPVWEEQIRIPFECVGDMWDLVFVRFVVRQEDGKDDEDPLAVYCVSLGSLGHGYRHLPLHDAQLSQYLFSTLFVKVQVLDDR